MIYLLQVQDTTIIGLFVAAISALTTALITVFALYKTATKERINAHVKHEETIERHAKTIQGIYESVVKESREGIAKMTAIVQENTRSTDEAVNETKELRVMTKELRETIVRLPEELRKILREK